MSATFLRNANAGAPMDNSPRDFKVIIASAVNDRDGIGIEIHIGNELVLEIFRGDTKKPREVRLHKQDVPLDIIEFKREMPWGFIEDDIRQE
ncbi:MAG: hypothetical protein LBD68_02725 [Zoogloeaceae bacterium]|jgi:hypothetical protein|nr:hypothetical protein [Zoogloeaceae bacterium]